MFFESASKRKQSFTKPKKMIGIFRLPPIAWSEILPQQGVAALLEAWEEGTSLFGWPIHGGNLYRPHGDLPRRAEKRGKYMLAL